MDTEIQAFLPRKLINILFEMLNVLVLRSVNGKNSENNATLSKFLHINVTRQVYTKLKYPKIENTVNDATLVVNLAIY